MRDWRIIYGQPPRYPRVYRGDLMFYMCDSWGYLMRKVQDGDAYVLAAPPFSGVFPPIDDPHAGEFRDAYMSVFERHKNDVYLKHDRYAHRLIAKIWAPVGDLSELHLIGGKWCSPDADSTKLIPPDLISALDASPHVIEWRVVEALS